MLRVAACTKVLVNAKAASLQAARTCGCVCATTYVVKVFKVPYCKRRCTAQARISLHAIFVVRGLSMRDVAKATDEPETRECIRRRY